MSAADDIIATLSSRVSELSKRVAMLQAELESAGKRVALYEEHDGTIQDALSGALRAAYHIRERAETTAEQILEQAREERRMLLTEIERLRDERDQLQEEIATQRRSGLAAVSARPLSSDAAAHELRAVASEALKGLFQEIVDDMRSTPRRVEPAPRMPEPPRRQEPPVVAGPPVTEPKAAPPPRAVEPAPPPTYVAMARMKRATLTEDEELAGPIPSPARAPLATTPAPVAAALAPTLVEPPAPLAAAPAPVAEREPAPEPTYEAMAAVERASLAGGEGPVEPTSYPAPTAAAEAAARLADAPAALEQRQPAPEPTYEATASAERATLTEEEEVIDTSAYSGAAPAAEASAPAPVAAAPVWAPVAPAPESAPRAEAEPPFWVVAEPTVAETRPPLEVVRPVERAEIAPPRVEAASPTSDIQLVLSPVTSFARLVEIERHIQALPVVRTLYVRDFRGGNATLAVALRSSMTPEEFAGMLAGLQQPRLRLLAGSRNRLELRIEGEASIA